MKIHEYQGKEILRQFGVPVPRGIPAFTVQEAVEAAQKLGGPVWVVKAQIHAGGRGKGGGVKVAKSIEDVKTLAEQILGMQLITHQTGPEGQQVRRLYIEDGADIKNELYVSLVTDRATQKVALIASSEGGMDIEEVAHATPEKIIKVFVDPALGLTGEQAMELCNGIGVPAASAAQCTDVLQKLYQCYMQTDASLVEINPLILEGNGGIKALDAKFNFDANALFRQTEIVAYRDLDEEDPAEVEAAHAAADALRQRFMNHRAVNGVVTSGHRCIVTTRDAVGAFIQSLVTARTPSGTVNTRRNQLGRMLVEPYGEVPVERLRDFAVGVVHRLNTEPKRNGQPKQPRTIEGSMAALGVFGAWAAHWYKIVDPFDGKLVSSTTAFREKSWAMVHSGDPFEDADAEESIDPDKLPTFVGISGLVDAIVRRETSRMAWHKTEGRGGKGGPRLLGLDVAVQLAESPRFIACTGVRCCEALAVHTSHLRLSTMELKVRRQLDRYQMWILGQDPPLCPPKGGHHRTVSI